MRILFTLFLNIVVSLFHLTLAQTNLTVDAPITFDINSGTASAPVAYVTRVDTKVNIFIKGISNPANLTVTVRSAGKTAQIISTTDLTSEAMTFPAGKMP